MHVESLASQRSRRVRVTSSSVPATEPNEHDRLIEAVAGHRDREAFARLFAFYAPRLKTWLVRSGAAPGAAEDFAQDTMLTVWRKADLFDARRAHAATWIFAIARNRRLDMLRRDARPLPAPELDLPGETPRPDEILVGREDGRRVREALDRLSPEQAEVLRLAYYLESPQSEIASRLGLPLGTVKSRIRNALIRLRTMLASPEEPAR